MIKKPNLFSLVFQKKKNLLPKSSLPKRKSKTIPGPKSLKLTEALKRFECPQVTYAGDPYPVFLKKATACNVTDVDGNCFLDLTSCFGVMSLGHNPKSVALAIRQQASQMIHGLGDIHPNEVKVLLAKVLSEITPGNLNQTIFSSTGAEAVESALKTAMMYTKKPGVIAFTGAYHGLTYGALNVTHRDDFRKPFMKQIGGFGSFAPFPDARRDGNKATALAIKAVESIIRKARRSKIPIGAIIVEPLQGRGGIMVPPSDFLPTLRALCDETGTLLIADEVFTGFGRTGTLFAVEKNAVVPDILCLGKGMASGFPISACIASTKVMHAWGPSTGDAIHTSTFLGHPLGCAVALAVIKEISEKRYVERSKTLGDFFRKELWKLKAKYPFISDIRGSGLMIGIELEEPPSAYSSRKQKPAPATEKAKIFVAEALRAGVILITSGPSHNVLSITPPFVISEKEIDFCVKLFDKIFQKL